MTIAPDKGNITPSIASLLAYYRVHARN